MSQQQWEPPTGERARIAVRQRRQRLLLVVLGGVAMAAVVIVAVVVAVSRGGGDEVVVDSYEGPLAPTAREPDGAVAMARPGVTTPVLDVYEDFQCPACRAMEARVGGTIKRLAAEGRVKVVYRPFQLFQQEPLMSNSRRAANAAACLPADRWVQYHDRLFNEQPAEGDLGFTNENLTAWAAELGVTGPDFATCVTGSQRIDQVDQASARAGRVGVDATPYLALNGAKVDHDLLGSPDGLRDAVAEAGGGRAPASGGARSSVGATGGDAATP
ncbi:hypothetical protein GCM10022254_26270 [Actinomadura meridiana]|uniref:Thioredoxin-like fold domain-containing protein n=1 Tax=Actinomadura meridiana TaxID=559626 RepID=A0ABP8C039_9ACTN